MFDIHKSGLSFIENHIVGSSQGRVKDYTIGMCCFSTRSI